MSTIVAADRETIKQIFSEALREVVTEELPPLVRDATRKPYLTRDELQQLTGWSIRTIVHLRQTRQIPFSQHGRKILYPTDGILSFLRENHVKPRSK